MTKTVKSFLQRISVMVNTEMEIVENIEKINIFTNLFVSSNSKDTLTSNELLTYALEIRKVLQKWSVIIEEESTYEKCLGQYCLFITCNCSKFIGLLTCKDDNNIESCLKILLYSFINCLKMEKEPHKLQLFFSSILEMIRSFDKVKEVKEYLSKSACHWIQNFSQFIYYSFERNDPSLISSMGEIIFQCLQTKFMFHYSSKSLSNEQFQKLIYYFLEAVLQYSDKIDTQVEDRSTFISEIRKYALLNLAVEYQLRCSRIFDMATRHLQVLQKYSSECYQRIQSLTTSLNQYLAAILQNDKDYFQIIDIEHLTKIALFTYNLCTFTQKVITKKQSAELDCPDKYNHKILTHFLITTKNIILKYRANNLTNSEGISTNFILCYLNFELLTYQNILDNNDDDAAYKDEEKRRERKSLLQFFSNCQIPPELIQSKEFKDFIIKSFIMAIQLEWKLVSATIPIINTITTTTTTNKIKTKCTTSSNSVQEASICDNKLSELISTLLRWSHSHQQNNITKNASTDTTTITTTDDTKRATTESDTTVQILLHILPPILNILQQSYAKPLISTADFYSFSYSLRILSQAIKALPLLSDGINSSNYNTTTTTTTTTTRQISSSKSMTQLLLSIRNCLSHIIQQLQLPQQQSHDSNIYTSDLIELSSSFSYFLQIFNESKKVANRDMFDLAMSIVSILATKSLSDGIIASSALLLISAINFHSKIIFPVRFDINEKSDDAMMTYPDRYFRLLHTLSSCCFKLPLRLAIVNDVDNTNTLSINNVCQISMEGFVQHLLNRESNDQVDVVVVKVAEEMIEIDNPIGFSKEDIYFRWEFLTSLSSDTIRRNDISVCRPIHFFLESIDPSHKYWECLLSKLTLESQCIWLFGEIGNCVTDRGRLAGDDEYRYRIVQQLKSFLSENCLVVEQKIITTNNNISNRGTGDIQSNDKKYDSCTSNTMAILQSDSVINCKEWKLSIVKISCKLRAISLLVQWIIYLLPPTTTCKSNLSTANNNNKNINNNKKMNNTVKINEINNVNSLYELFQSFLATMHQMLELMTATWDVIRKCHILTEIPMLLLPTSIMTDCKCLFDAMTITGYLKQQQSLVDILEQIEAIRSLKEMSPLCFYSTNFSSILYEMKAILLLQSVMHAIPITTNMNSYISNSCNGNSYSNISNSYKSVFNCVVIAEEILSEETDGSTINIEEEKGEGGYGWRSSSQDSENSIRCLSLERTVTELINNDNSCSNSNSTPATIPVSVKAWCCVLVAKVFYLLGFRTRDSFAWSRHVLALTNIQRNSNTVINRSNIKCISSELVVVRLEALLLISDLYEFIGDARSSLGYLGEAQTLAKCYPDEQGGDGSLFSLVTLHSLRLMHRIGSTRFMPTLTTLLENTHFIANNNTINDLCHQAAKCLRLLISEYNNNNNNANNSNTNNNTSIPSTIINPIKFRYLTMVWDLVTGDTSSVVRFHTPMAAITRKCLKSLMTQNTRIAMSLSGIAGCPEISKPIKQNNDSMSNQSSEFSNCFDANRIMRRYQAVQCIHSFTGYHSNNILPFALAAGSCGVSAESQIYSKANDNSNNIDINMLRSKLAINMVQEACSLHHPSIQGLSMLRSTLSSICSSLSAGADMNHSNGVICFLVIEKITCQLLIGRYDNISGSLVCGVPFSEKLQSLLTEWDEVMNTNKSLLQKTSTTATTIANSASSSDTNKVSLTQWSENDKKDWWNHRKQGNDNMENLLERLQVALGLWRCLLFDNNNNYNTTINLEDSESWFYNQIKSITTKLSTERILQEPLSNKSRVPLKPKGKGKTPSIKIEVKNNSTTPSHISDVLPVSQETLQSGWNWIKYLLHCLADDSHSNHLSDLEVHSGIVIIVSKLLESTSITIASVEVTESLSLWKESLAKMLIESYKKQRNSEITSSTTNQLLSASVGEVTFELQSMQLKENMSPTVCNIITELENGTTSLSLDDIEAMKVTELRVKLKELNASTLGRKSDLVARLAEISLSTNIKPLANNLQQNHDNIPIKIKSKTDDTTNLNTSGKSMPDSFKDHSGSTNISKRSGHLVLLLCETLQKLPWESIPLLRDRSCSRMPSLTALLSSYLNNLSNEELSDIYSTSIKSCNSSCSSSMSLISHSKENRREYLNVDKCWYVIDPEANLPSTRETMESFLSPLIDSLSWKGFVAEIPSEDVVRDYHNSNDLFIYCGHGAGERLHNEKSSKFRKCQFPAAFLWGCSSGQLLMHGVHDPTGPLLTYIEGGAPWVVGNLWDVTDKDIDRLSVRCMSQVFGLQHQQHQQQQQQQQFQLGATPDDSGSEIVSGDVCLSLSASREVCKLKYLVGCAPVVYGLPLAVTTHS